MIFDEINLTATTYYDVERSHFPADQHSAAVFEMPPPPLKDWAKKRRPSVENNERRDSVGVISPKFCPVNLND